MKSPKRYLDPKKLVDENNFEFQEDFGLVHLWVNNDNDYNNGKLCVVLFETLFNDTEGALQVTVCGVDEYPFGAGAIETASAILKEYVRPSTKKHENSVYQGVFNYQDDYDTREKIITEQFYLYFDDVNDAKQYLANMIINHA